MAPIPLVFYIYYIHLLHNKGTMHHVYQICITTVCNNPCRSGDSHARASVACFFRCSCLAVADLTRLTPICQRCNLSLVLCVAQLRPGDSVPRRSARTAQFPALLLRLEYVQSSAEGTPRCHGLSSAGVLLPRSLPLPTSQ